MHKLSVKILGPSTFVSTLNELKSFLSLILINGLNDNPIAILFHDWCSIKTLIKKIILIVKFNKNMCRKKKWFKNNFDANLELPTAIKRN